MQDSDHKSTGLQRYRQVAATAAATAVIAGPMVLAGWLFGIPLLTDFTFDGITMKANTAVALGLAGLSLFLLLPENGSRPRYAAGHTLAVLVSLIGAATLSEHIFGWDLGIDQLLVPEPSGAAATVSPGRMGPPASTSYTLIGIGLILLNRRAQWAYIMAQAIALSVAAITLPSLVGNMYGARELHALAPYTGISRQTAMLLLLFAAGMLSARADRGLMAVFSSEEMGGVTLRRLLGPSVIFPILFGLLCAHGIRSGLFDISFGLALFAIWLVIALVAVAWWNGKALNMMSGQRREAQEERERLLESERHARMEMERAARLKDEFLATLSHELRTPLNAIIGWTELLRSGRVSDPAARDKGIEVIARNARVQSELIGDLLDMSRIVSGKMRLQMQAVDLPAVLSAAVESVRPAAEQRGLRIRTAFGRMDRPVTGDSARLQQVFWNLLSNAVKFTPKGGFVDVGLSTTPSNVKVTITDTGQGIAPEFLPHVFGRFRQADATITRQHGGLGLGLAIVKELVELHGGTVSLHSEGDGRGVTSTVELPFPAAGEQPSASTGPGETQAQTEALPALPDLNGYKVLVLEDDADGRDVIVRFLSECRAAVKGASSAEEVIALSRDQQFDLLISDIGLPNMSGFELIRHLRAAGISMPSIALTAYARPEDRARALEAGFQSHLAKPVDRTELLDQVAALLPPRLAARRMIS